MDYAATEPAKTDACEATDKIKASLKQLARIKKQAELAAFCFAATMFMNWLVSDLHYSKTLHHVIHFILIGIALFSGCIGIYLSGRYDKVSARLSNLNDVTYLGPLLDTISTRQLGMPAALRLPLINLLNQIQASQSHLLCVSHRRKLHAMLVPASWKGRSLYNRQVAGAILTALEQVGDKEAIPYVEKVALSGEDVVLREAAEACLVFLRQRAAEQNATETLLRPSDAENATPESLLRASVARPEDAPDRLLRATVAPDAGESAGC